MDFIAQLEQNSGLFFNQENNWNVSTSPTTKNYVKICAKCVAGNIINYVVREYTYHAGQSGHVPVWSVNPT